MKIGKLPNSVLKKLVLDAAKEHGSTIKEVLEGPSVGEDCALLDFENNLILISTDPITATEDNIGKLLINVCANDIAASGGTPIGIMVSVLIPPETDEGRLKSVMDDMLSEAKKLGIALLGGHTEVTDAVTRIVLTGTILGRVERNSDIKTGGSKPGNKLVMTKSAGLEGTYILACEYSDRLLEKFGQNFVENAKKHSESISVLNEARIAKDFGVNGMHDITEGGLIGACAEMSEACGHGLLIDLGKVSVEEETRKICEYFRISPYELISSGALLITADNGEGLVSELAKNGIRASVIGEVITGESRVIDLCGNAGGLVPPSSDAIYCVKPPSKEGTVVFVCTGNTCRSPMAEGFALSMKNENSIDCGFNSRGINVCEGAVLENSLAVMENKGIDISGVTPEMFTAVDAERAELILTMTNAHKSFILNKYGYIDRIGKKLFTLSEYAGENNGADVCDPFGGSLEAYAKCADEIEMLVAAVMKRLMNSIT